MKRSPSAFVISRNNWIVGTDVIAIVMSFTEGGKNKWRKIKY